MCSYYKKFKKGSDCILAMLEDLLFLQFLMYVFMQLFRKTGCVFVNDPALMSTLVAVLLFLSALVGFLKIFIARVLLLYHYQKAQK